MNVIEGQAQTHQAVWDLLPWYVNKTLGTADCQKVEAHLRDCPACRAELAAQTRLCRAVARSGIDHRQADLAWDRLENRLGKPANGRAMRTVLAGLAASVAVLAVGWGVLLRGVDQPGYVTMTETARAPLAESIVLLRIRLAPGVPPLEGMQVLREVGLIDLAPPSETGLIIAKVPEGGNATSLTAALMRHPAIAYVAGD